MRNENIDCDLVLTRSMEVCLEEKGAAELKRKLDAVRDAGVDVRDVVYSEGKGAEEVSTVSFGVLEMARCMLRGCVSVVL